MAAWENGSGQSEYGKDVFCLPPSSTFFIEKIIDAHEEHNRKVSISSKSTCTCIINLQFADDIDAVAEEEQGQEALVESLSSKTCTRYMYKMEINAEKTKLMTNRANGIQREIMVKGQKLGAITSFKQLFKIMAQNRRFCQALHKPL